MTCSLALQFSSPLQGSPGLASTLSSFHGKARPTPTTSLLISECSAIWDFYLGVLLILSRGKFISTPPKRMPLPDFPFLLTILSHSPRLDAPHPTWLTPLQVLPRVPRKFFHIPLFTVLLPHNSSQTGSSIRTKADSDIFIGLPIPKSY